MSQLTTLSVLKISAALVILLITFIGGLWPFFKKARQNKRSIMQAINFSSGEAFTSGIFLAVALLHILPEANESFTQAGYHYPYAFLIAAASFLFLLMLEHISVSWSHKVGSLFSGMVFLTLTMMSIHSLFEGSAVGMTTNFTTTIVILAAILAHKGAESFALSIHLNRSNLTFMTRLLAFCFFAFMTPLGIFSGSLISSATENNVLLSPIFNALSAGTFLYIGTLHGLDRASLIKECCNMKEFAYMVLGFAIMAVLAIYHQHDHHGTHHHCQHQTQHLAKSK